MHHSWLNTGALRSGACHHATQPCQWIKIINKKLMIAQSQHSACCTAKHSWNAWEWTLNNTHAGQCCCIWATFYANVDHQSAIHLSSSAFLKIWNVFVLFHLCWLKMCTFGISLWKELVDKLFLFVNWFQCHHRNIFYIATKKKEKKADRVFEVSTEVTVRTTGQFHIFSDLHVMLISNTSLLWRKTSY